MTRDEAKERLRAALEAQIPEGMNRKGWIARQADSIPNMKPSRFETHLYGEVECGMADLLAYFEHFGPDFEAKVRRTEVTQINDLDDLRQKSRELQEAIENFGRPRAVERKERVQ